MATNLPVISVFAFDISELFHTGDRDEDYLLMIHLYVSVSTFQCFEGLF